MVDGVAPEIQTNLVEPTILLGRGGYGQVIKAKYQGGWVAMKVLEKDDEKSRQYFVNEMEQLYNLRHPNIIQVIGKCNCNRKLAFIMELMDDGSLEDLLHRRLRLAYKPDHIVSWSRQCADAVSFIHGRGLVHRDLKPNNLLLKNGYRLLKLCDFGSVAAVKTSMTNNLGTPIWMAPEVFMSKKYDMKCDVYSFGITLWEMTTRKRPFKSDASVYTILWKACEGHRPPLINGLSELCSPFWDLITACWHKEPDTRPTMSEVLERLTELARIYPNGSDPLISLEEIRRDDQAPVCSAVLDENIISPSLSNTVVEDNHFVSESMEPELRPIGFPSTCRENGRDLYLDQVAACRELRSIKEGLQKAYRFKHELLHQIRTEEDVSKQLEKRDSLRAMLQEMHVRICSLKQVPPSPSR